MAPTSTYWPEAQKLPAVSVSGPGGGFRPNRYWGDRLPTAYHTLAAGTTYTTSGLHSWHGSLWMGQYDSHGNSGGMGSMTPSRLSLRSVRRI